MNRVIKFRAWQKYHKKMVEVTNISFDDNGEINGVATFVENQAPQHISYRDDLLGRFFLKDERGMVLELMQFTGLKDKNGVEIYEGDVVSMIVFEDNAEYLGDVIFENGCFCLNISLDGTKYKVPTLEWKETETIITVVGNIYENPELLERESE